MGFILYSLKLNRNFVKKKSSIYWFEIQIDKLTKLHFCDIFSLSKKHKNKDELIENTSRETPTVPIY